MSLFFRKSGIVNVKMVITEEKILSNIDKIQKLINPNSKKQIVQLEEDSYFQDLIASIKSYLEEYPKEEKFPSSQTFSQFNRLIIHYFFLNFKSFFIFVLYFIKKVS